MVKWMLGDMFTAPNPRLAIFFIGLKDSMTELVTKTRYISPEAFGNNVRAIANKGKQAGVKYFLFITPPPVCEVCRSGPPPWDRNNNHTRLYVNQLYDVAKSLGGTVIDIFSKWQTIPNWHNVYLLPDHLHLNEFGQKTVLDEIMGTLLKSIPQMHPSKMPLLFPSQPDINVTDPAPAFSKVDYRGCPAP